MSATPSKAVLITVMNSVMPKASHQIALLSTVT